MAIGLLAGTPSAAAANVCHADATLDESIDRIAETADRWDCRPARQSLEAQRALLRFEIDPRDPAPRYLETRRAALESIHLRVSSRDGRVAYASFTPGRIEQSREGGYIRVPLPETGAPPVTVIAAIDLPTHAMTLEQARLVPAAAHEAPGARRLLLMLAGLCGMLLMPLMFNAAFYRILRERFVLWHSALAVTLLLTIVVNSGLAYQLLDIPVMALSSLSTLMFGLSVTAAGMFAHSFIEPDKLDERLRRALPVAAGWAALASILHATMPFVLRPWQSSLYYLAFLPVLMVYLTVIIDALRRGSRAARFQAVGWTPLVVVCLIRLVSGLVPSIPSTDAMLLFFLGCVVEVLATTLGVADRFMAIKDQRDHARTEAQVLERLSERDALTGLMNRRVIEDRFEALRAAGFTTLAVLDLDHFKFVNDQHGHGVGDEVLRSVASALEPDENTLAFRLGGEEFLILLRGRDAMRRAEARRRAITAHVARDVVGLARPQTASMGLIEVPPDAMPNATFAELYSRADRLLYESKQAGRNRTLSERLKVFVPRRRTERRQRAA
ncbi:MAG: sensor domain-containing diguanylate cyclase [Croceibacterium sp.]